jgi:hypothetical protein
MVGCEFDKAESVLIFWMEKSKTAELLPWNTLLMSTYCNLLINIKDSARVINLIGGKLEIIENGFRQFLVATEIDDKEKLLAKSSVLLLICYKTAFQTGFVDINGASPGFKELRGLGMEILRKHFVTDPQVNTLVKALKVKSSGGQSRPRDASRDRDRRPGSRGLPKKSLERNEKSRVEDGNSMQRTEERNKSRER